MKIVWEFDDLNPHKDVDCLFIINHLVEQFPNIVLNFFTVPKYQGIGLYTDYKWSDSIRNLIDSGNVCLGVHGYLHTQEEFKNKTYGEAYDSLCYAEGGFFDADLPFVKAFRGPHWGINYDTCLALLHAGFSHLYSHQDYFNLNNEFSDHIKIVYYNWNLKDDWGEFENPPEDEGIIVAHGHTSNQQRLSCGNSIWNVYPKIEEFMEEFEPECLRLNEI